MYLIWERRRYIWKEEEEEDGEGTYGRREAMSTGRRRVGWWKCIVPPLTYMEAALKWEGWGGGGCSREGGKILYLAASGRGNMPEEGKALWKHACLWRRKENASGLPICQGECRGGNSINYMGNMFHIGTSGRSTSFSPGSHRKMEEANRLPCLISFSASYIYSYGEKKRHLQCKWKEEEGRPLGKGEQWEAYGKIPGR